MPARSLGGTAVAPAAFSGCRRRIALQHRPWLELLTRLGFAARGLLYIVIGVLVIETGRSEDPAGVLQYLAGNTGKWLLVAMTAGFAGYGLWRLADAVFAIECDGEEREWLKRIAAGVSGAVYLYLAKQSAELALGGSQLVEAQDHAQTVLQLPGGQVALALVAAGLLVAGLIQLHVAADCRFLGRLDQAVRDTWVKWLGRAGYAARGIVFLSASFLLALAAFKGRSNNAGGIEQVLEWLASPFDTIIAAGLLLFGIFGLIEARYRRIRTPDPEALAQQAKAQLSG